MSRTSLAHHRSHLPGLDLLRGLAAIAVVIYHLSIRLELEMLPHGYLAVDFFFTLSGYVLAMSYMSSLKKGALSIRSFCVKRAIRLMPLIILGTLIAAAMEFRRPEAVGSHHLMDTAAALVLGAMALPILWTTSLERAMTFPLNAPVWSLFFEILASVTFAVVVNQKRSGALAACFCLGGMLLLVYAAFDAGNIDFGPHIQFFAFGFARVAWSFSIGVMIYCANIKADGCSLLGLALVMISVLVFPQLGKYEPIFCLFAVTLAFPLIVTYAAAPSASFLPRLSKASGDISYPIYALHYPMVRASAFAIRGAHLGGASTFAAITITIGAVLLVAEAALRLYDAPLRRWLAYRLAGDGLKRVEKSQSVCPPT